MNVHHLGVVDVLTPVSIRLNYRLNLIYFHSDSHEDRDSVSVVYVVESYLVLQKYMQYCYY